MTDAAQYAELRNELIRNDAMVNPASGKTPSEVTLWKTDEEIQKYKDGSDPWRYPNTDWYKETFRDWAPQQYHNASIEGGTDKVQYFAAFGFKTQDNHFTNGYGGFDQYNLRINLDAQINDYIKTSVSLMGREERRTRGSQDAGDLLWFTSRGRPTDHAFWPNGLPGPAQEYGRNPVVGASNETGYLKEKTYYIQTTAKAEITQPWIEGLKLTLNISYDKALFRGREWFQPWYLWSWDGIKVDENNIPILDKGLNYPSHSDPSLKETSYDQTNSTVGALLTYDRTFGDHGISILVGTEKDLGDKNYFDAYRRYYLSNALQMLGAGGDLEKTNSSGSIGDMWKNNWDRRRMNYFGRVAYNYKEKYLAEFLWRYDGSYMFPKDNRYGFFPGILLGYRISEENFWKENFTFMDYFKLRGSWSSVGYDKVYYDNKMQEFQFLSTYKYEWGYIIDNKDVKGLRISRFPNPNITWERTDMFNLGIEGRTFNSRLSFEADVFMNKRSNILWKRNASIPQSAGLELPAENIGKVENKGFDFKLAWNDRVGKDFLYNLTFSGGYSKDKIVFWDEAPGAPEWQKSTGHMSGAKDDLYYIFDGVFKNWDEINDKNNRPNYDKITQDENLKPGDMKFKDIDGDGEITPNDRKRIDRTNIPKWNLGFNSYFQYRDFDLTLLFQGAFDAWTKVYFNSGELGNYSKEIYDNHWSINNPTDKHPRVHAREAYYWDSSDGGKNTYWMQRTDYVRLKNIELGYTLPRHIVQKTKFFSFMRVYINGQNILTFTGIDRDPESTSNGASAYPLAKVFNAGFSLTF